MNNALWLDNLEVISMTTEGMRMAELVKGVNCDWPEYQEYGPRAEAILWVSPKIKFERPDGTRGEWPGTGTALFACGGRAVDALSRSRLGFVTVPKRSTE